MTINKYNDMPLEKAREKIIEKLLQKDSEIDELLEEKRKSLAENEQAMILARADGDASENSALETAIKNIQRDHGEIDDLMVLKGRLDAIREYSYVKGKYDYKSLVDILNSAKMNSDGYTLALDLIRILPNQEDLYEGLYNVKASDVKQLEMTYMQSESKDSLNADDRELLSRLDSLYNISKVRKYKPTGICLEYSTVRVLVDDGTSKTVFTGFICPEGISFIEDGIFAANSQLAKLLIGNSINTNKFVNGNITYKLLELY